MIRCDFIDWHGRIDAYLDGQLSLEMEQAFEAQLEVDDALAEAVFQQREIDNALGRAFAVPASLAQAVSAPGLAPAAEASGPGAEAPGAGPLSFAELAEVREVAEADVAAEGRHFRFGETAWYGIAAGLILAVFLGGRGYIYYSLERPTERRLMKVSNVSQISDGIGYVYRTEVREGFRPLWSCDNNIELAVLLHRQTGQGLAIDLPGQFAPVDPAYRHKTYVPPIELLGLSHGNAISPWSTYIMAKSHGEKVMVFADRLHRDRPQTVPVGMKMFRRELGDLVLYEVTPLPYPTVVNRLRKLEVPNLWLSEVEVQ